MPQAAAAIENALLFETASRRLARLTALTEIGREISQERDPDVLLGLITRRATELLGGDSASVFLLDQASGRLHPQASHNWDDVGAVAIGPGEGLCGAVALRRAGILVNDYPHSPYAITPFRERDWALVAQPLVHGDALFGEVDERLHRIAVGRRELADRPRLRRREVLDARLVLGLHLLIGDGGAIKKIVRREA